MIKESSKTENSRNKDNAGDHHHDRHPGLHEVGGQGGEQPSEG